jgi:hypothetical protein
MVVLFYWHRDKGSALTRFSFSTNYFFIIISFICLFMVVGIWCRKKQFKNVFVISYYYLRVQCRALPYFYYFINQPIRNGSIIFKAYVLLLNKMIYFCPFIVRSNVLFRKKYVNVTVWISCSPLKWLDGQKGIQCTLWNINDDFTNERFVKKSFYRNNLTLPDNSFVFALNTRLYFIPEMLHIENVG